MSSRALPQDPDHGITTDTRSRHDGNVLASASSTAGVAVGLKFDQHRPAVAGDPSFTVAEAKFKQELDKSKDEIDKFKDDVEMAEAKLEKAEAKLEKAEAKRVMTEVELETAQSDRSLALTFKGRDSEEFALAEQKVTRCMHKFDDAQQGVHDARRLVTIATDTLHALSRRYLGT